MVQAHALMTNGSTQPAAQAPAQWQTSRFLLDLSKPQVMGIVNVTPDSFSDGGLHASTRAALQHCEQLLKDGAHILDIGGESSRPGAAPLPLAEELARVLPVVQGAVRLGVPVSVDTYKSEVMQAVLDAGADIINDIWAFRQSGSARVVAHYPTSGLVLMHMHRNPQTMQTAPMECGDVVAQVASDLLSFCELLPQYSIGLEAKNVYKNRIVLDPGIGFGKTVAQNFALLARQAELLRLGYPLLAGWSRKSSLGAVIGLEPAQRMVPSVAAALLAVQRGASIVRVHDVRETVQALQVWQAVNAAV
jgi:dihydropteroate synthase